MELDLRGHNVGTSVREGYTSTTAYITKVFPLASVGLEEVDSYRYRCLIVPVEGEAKEKCS